MHEEPKLLCMKMQIQNLFLRVVPFQPKTKETKKEERFMDALRSTYKGKNIPGNQSNFQDHRPRPTNTKAVVFSLCNQMKYFPVEIGIRNKYEWDHKIDSSELCKICTPTSISEAYERLM